MMQTQPRSKKKSLAPPGNCNAREPPPGSAPPLVPGTRGEAGMQKLLGRERRAVPRKRGARVAGCAASVDT